ncbi:Uncharacterized protein APZ42_002040, partial [Daphnia magna]
DTRKEKLSPIAKQYPKKTNYSQIKTFFSPVLNAEFQPEDERDEDELWNERTAEYHPATGDADLSYRQLSSESDKESYDAEGTVGLLTSFNYTTPIIRKATGNRTLTQTHLEPPDDKHGRRTSQVQGTPCLPGQRRRRRCRLDGSIRGASRLQPVDRRRHTSKLRHLPRRTSKTVVPMPDTTQRVKRHCGCSSHQTTGQNTGEKRNAFHLHNRIPTRQLCRISRKETTEPQTRHKRTRRRILLQDNQLMLIDGPEHVRRSKTAPPLRRTKTYISGENLGPKTQNLHRISSNGKEKHRSS